MTRVATLIALSMMIPAAAHAQDPYELFDFEITITNHSNRDWSEGVAAVLEAGSYGGALLPVGAAPEEFFETYPTYLFGHETCGAPDNQAGDPGPVRAAFDPALGTSHLVPALEMGEHHTFIVTAYPGSSSVPGLGLSYVASVVPEDGDEFPHDDVVMMHVPGNPGITRVPLFNNQRQPLFQAEFDIGGYDVNSTSPNDGTAPDCGATCPPPASGCFVAYGNDTVGADAGGPQVLPELPDFNLYAGVALAPHPGTFYKNGVGSPTVVYRRRANGGIPFVMFFETQLDDPSPECPNGKWGIGLATSQNGANWAVTGNDPILAPQPGTFYSCVAAQPTALIAGEGDNGMIDVWFKGEQGSDACDDDPPPWGCSVFTGVGHVRLTQNLTLAGTPTQVLHQGQVFGFPSVTKKGSTYHMLLSTYPDLYHTTAPAPDGPWSTPANVMGAGSPLGSTVSWASTEVFNPVLTCADTAPYPLHAFFGGRTVVGGTIVEGGIGDALSPDGTTWLAAVEPFEFGFAGDDAFRHWDVVRLTGDEFLMYYSERIDGKNHVRMASTVANWTVGGVTSGHCPAPSWW